MNIPQELSQKRLWKSLVRFFDRTRLHGTEQLNTQQSSQKKPKELRHKTLTGEQAKSTTEVHGRCTITRLQAFTNSADHPRHGMETCIKKLYIYINTLMFPLSSIRQLAIPVYWFSSVILSKWWVETYVSMYCYSHCFHLDRLQFSSSFSALWLWACDDTSQTRATHTSLSQRMQRHVVLNWHTVLHPALVNEHASTSSNNVYTFLYIYWTCQHDKQHNIIYIYICIIYIYRYPYIYTYTFIPFAWIHVYYMYYVYTSRQVFHCVLFVQISSRRTDQLEMCIPKWVYPKPGTGNQNVVETI